MLKYTAPVRRGFALLMMAVRAGQTIEQYSEAITAPQRDNLKKAWEWMVQEADGQHDKDNPTAPSVTLTRNRTD
jgi:hypothetical protein